MTVHTPDYALLRLALAFLTCGWAKHVDFDPTEAPDLEPA